MPIVKTASTRKAKRRDQIARLVITLGGIAVIASVAAILALIVGVTIPLFRSPRADVAASCPLPDSLRPAGEDRSKSQNADSPHPNPLPKGEGTVLCLGVDMDIDGSGLTGFVWLRNGTVAWINLRTGELLGQKRLSASEGDAKSALRHVESLGKGKYSLDWSNGAASLVEIAVQKPDRNNAQAERYSIRTPAALPETHQEFEQVFLRRSESGALTRVARVSDATIAILRQTVSESLLGDEETSTYENVLRDDIIAHIRVMTMDHEGSALYAGTDDGRLVRWQLDEKGEVAHRQVVQAYADGRAVTALALALGDVSLAVGDAKGELVVWTPVHADGTLKLRAIHRLQPHASAVREIMPCRRKKSILSLGEDGAVHLDHITSERRLVSIDSNPSCPLRQACLGERGDALLGLDASGALSAWSIDDGYPEISFKTLFGKVHYEGYDQPEYVWQTTGGDDFEPKFSLVPLIFGTLKGTFYAMLFAVPLALFGAMYLSYFTTPGLRKTIKPVVEIMASVPSVVIGFLIALWLAPILERWALGFFMCMITVPAAFVVFMILWQWMRRFDWAKRVENGHEFLVALPVLLTGVGIAVALTAPFEAGFFNGSFHRWLFDGPLSIQYDQRNSVIIAFGLGFTVIPVIFSIAEDSLSNVPYHLTAASMAVGASRWQTLWRVVLPSASPGIFAAMMIGFGRAVGETMIVLMATGNTPILDWSPFNGMRTLSANIAVEIPEAPVGGTLYRVLFLCAVLLFLLTFTVNTAAELVRQRLRKQFGRF